jgi:hypothetical protein
MTEETNAAPQGASEPESIASVEDKLASFDFDAPPAPAGETEKPQEAGDDEVLETLAGETGTQETAPEDDDPDEILRDGTKVKRSELKRAYRPDWEKQVQEFSQRQEAFQRAIAGFTQDQQRAAQLLQNAVAVVQSKMPKPPDERLLDTDPFEYQKQDHLFKKAQGELHNLKAAQAYQFQQIRQQQQHQQRIRLHQEKEAVLRILPDFKDPVKFAKFSEEAKEYATTRGYKPSDLDGVYDHRLLAVIHDAVEGRRIKADLAKTKERLAKLKAEAVKTPVEVQAPQKRRTPSQVESESLRAQMDRLRKNPSSTKVQEDVLGRFK